MADDSYKTIKQIAEGYYTEKRSRFISYAIPVRTVEEVKENWTNIVNSIMTPAMSAGPIC